MKRLSLTLSAVITSALAQQDEDVQAQLIEAQNDEVREQDNDIATVEADGSYESDPIKMCWLIGLPEREDEENIADGYCSTSVNWSLSKDVYYDR